MSALAVQDAHLPSIHALGEPHYPQWLTRPSLIWPHSPSDFVFNHPPFSWLTLLQPYQSLSCCPNLPGTLLLQGLYNDHALFLENLSHESTQLTPSPTQVFFQCHLFRGDFPFLNALFNIAYSHHSQPTILYTSPQSFSPLAYHIIYLSILLSIFHFYVLEKLVQFKP